MTSMRNDLLHKLANKAQPGPMERICGNWLQPHSDEVFSKFLTPQELFFGERDRLAKKGPRVCQGGNPGSGVVTGGQNRYLSTNANGNPITQRDKFFDIREKAPSAGNKCAIYFPSVAWNWRQVPVDKSEGRPAILPARGERVFSFSTR
jgi:hypothetical protein